MSSISSILENKSHEQNLLQRDVYSNFKITPGHKFIWLRIDFSENDASSQLNGFFRINGLHGMLEGKYYQGVDMVFSFIERYVDRVTEYEHEPQLTEITTLCSELIGYIRFEKGMTVINDKLIG